MGFLGGQVIACAVRKGILTAGREQEKHLVGAADIQRPRPALAADGCAVEHQPQLFSVGIHNHPAVIQRAGEQVGASAGDGDDGAGNGGAGAVHRDGVPGKGDTGRVCLVIGGAQIVIRVAEIHIFSGCADAAVCIADRYGAV